jgi:Ca-activated chloride channel family protein
MTKRGWPLALACVALAAGGIVLLRAPGHAAPRAVAPVGLGGGHAVTPLAPSASGATRVQLTGPMLSGHLAVAESAVLANGTRRVLAELRVTADESAERGERQPVALAVVMDVSGSMCGQKIEQAKDAVRQLVQRLRPADRIALVTYDHETNVVQPLTGASGRGALEQRIAAIQCRGGTLIPPALERGARELEGAPSHLVRRLVLLSDGLDGSGLSMDMVSSMIRTRSVAGISTSALGIGADYDERFMTSVADAGRGNYEFLANADQLRSFLHRELDEAGATVVDAVEAYVALPPGMRLRSVIGAESHGGDGEQRIAFGPLFAGDSRRAVLDLEADAGAPGALGAVVARLAYRVVADDARHVLGPVALALSAVSTDAEVAASRDQAIYGETWAAVIDTEQKQAVEAWRAGDAARAQALSLGNLQRLRRVAAEAPAAAAMLEEQAAELQDDTDSFANVSAASDEGRAYGLGSNARRRARAMH